MLRIKVVHHRSGATHRCRPRSNQFQSYKFPENVDFAAQERALEASANERPAMIKSIAKALTRRLLKANPGTGAQEFSERV
jgi:hypothetical protein